MGGEIIRTMAGVARRIGVGSRETARQYALLEVDPLPLRSFRGIVWAPALYLDEWSARFFRHGEGLSRIVGLRGMAEAVGRGATEEQILTWARLGRDPFPILNLRDPKARREDRLEVFAPALRDWCHRHDLPYAIGLGSAGPVDPFAATGPRLLVQRRSGHVSAVRAERPKIEGDRARRSGQCSAEKAA